MLLDFRDLTRTGISNTARRLIYCNTSTQPCAFGHKPLCFGTQRGAFRCTYNLLHRAFDNLKGWRSCNARGIANGRCDRFNLRANWPELVPVAQVVFGLRNLKLVNRFHALRKAKLCNQGLKFFTSQLLSFAMLTIFSEPMYCTIYKRNIMEQEEGKEEELTVSGVFINIYYKRFLHSAIICLTLLFRLCPCVVYHAWQYIIGCKYIWFDFDDIE